MIQSRLKYNEMWYDRSVHIVLWKPGEGTLTQSWGSWKASDSVISQGRGCPKHFIHFIKF